MKSTATECPETCVTPLGRVTLDVTSLERPVAVAETSEAVAAFTKRFTKRFTKSVADGLTFLASQKCDLTLSVSLAYWRDFSRSYFRALCRQGVPNEQWISPTPPDESTLSDLCLSAPPMRGLEYLTGDVLTNLWNELDTFTNQKAMARKSGLPGYLQQLHADWNLVGRVTFI